ncbi:hypothetical protein [Xenorhabdus griffiniae]
MSKEKGQFLAFFIKVNIPIIFQDASYYLPAQRGDINNHIDLQAAT